MGLNVAFISGRVAAACLLFAFFVLTSLKSRFRYSVRATGTLFGLLIVFTVVVTIVFLTHDKNLSGYSGFGITFWFFSAVLIFRLTIKGSYYELLFLVLVVHNLYANIMVISKIIVGALALTMTPSEDAAMALISIGVMIAYAPLLWLLFIRKYKQVIEIRIRLSFWNYIWMIPALTYLIFYIKIITEYWKQYEVADTSDIVFFCFVVVYYICVFWDDASDGYRVLSRHRGGGTGKKDCLSAGNAKGTICRIGILFRKDILSKTRLETPSLHDQRLCE